MLDYAGGKSDAGDRSVAAETGSPLGQRAVTESRWFYPLAGCHGGVGSVVVFADGSIAAIDVDDREGLAPGARAPLRAAVPGAGVAPDRHGSDGGPALGGGGGAEPGALSNSAPHDVHDVDDVPARVTWLARDWCGRCTRSSLLCGVIDGDD